MATKGSLYPNYDVWLNMTSGELIVIQQVTKVNALIFYGLLAKTGLAKSLAKSSAYLAVTLL